jgi:hypothetical protein
MDFYNNIDAVYEEIKIELIKGEYNSVKLFKAIENEINAVVLIDGAINPDVVILSNGNNDIADIETPYFKIE